MRAGSIPLWCLLLRLCKASIGCWGRGVRVCLQKVQEKALGMVPRMGFSKQLGVRELQHMPYYSCWVTSSFLVGFHVWSRSSIVGMLLSGSSHFNAVPEHLPTTQRPLNASSLLQQPCVRWLLGF